MCFYTLRGSFKGKKQTELREGMKQHRAVKEEWLAARTSGLVQSARWNTTPYRHTAIPSSYQPHVTGPHWILGIGFQLDGSWTGLDNSNHVAVGSRFFRRWMDWEFSDFVIADFGCRLRGTKFLQVSEEKILHRVNNPGWKAKRPKVDYVHLVRRSEEDYVDFQQVKSPWVTECIAYLSCRVPLKKFSEAYLAWHASYIWFTIPHVEKIPKWSKHDVVFLILFSAKFSRNCYMVRTVEITGIALKVVNA